MLIEDNLNLGESLVELLSLFKYEVILLNSFNAFLNYQTSLNTNDVVVSDFYLGDGTFKEVVGVLRDKNMLRQTICITAAAEEQDLIFAKTHASNLLNKPFRIENLLSAIELCKTT